MYFQVSLHIERFVGLFLVAHQLVLSGKTALKILLNSYI